MTRIYAELNRMGKGSSNLLSYEESFDSLRKGMNNIVTTLGTVWQGEDAKTFYEHAEDYLNSLIRAQNVMIYFSNKMNGKSKKYSSAYDEYKERIRRYEASLGNNDTVNIVPNSLEIGEKE